MNTFDQTFDIGLKKWHIECSECYCITITLVSLNSDKSTKKY